MVNRNDIEIQVWRNPWEEQVWNTYCIYFNVNNALNRSVRLNVEGSIKLMIYSNIELAINKTILNCKSQMASNYKII